jgi:hypothetical protein
MKNKLLSAKKRLKEAVKKKIKDEIEVIGKFYEQYRHSDDTPVIGSKRWSFVQLLGTVLQITNFFMREPSLFYFLNLRYNNLNIMVDYG